MTSVFGSTPSLFQAMKPSRLIHKTGLATDDINGLADYYRQEAGLAVALRFVDSAERAFEHLLEMPKTGALLGLDELPYEDIRRWHINGFDRLIILYHETADGIEIVRVLHTSRDIAALLRD
jgi:toxin ParE1/3/4